MNKSQLRLQLQKKLRSIPEQEKAKKSRLACKKLISTEEFQRSSVIMLFLSLPTEVDTSDAVLYAWQMGKIVVMPKISWQQRHMIPVVITSLEKGFTTEFGVLRNPVTGTPMPFSEIDMVVAPGLGFDRKSNRLGRGGSYYDRFFKNQDLNAIRCGLAFDEQVVDDVPITDSDMPVNMLVTDKEIFYFDKQQQ